ncbi:MAG: hypothetical protein QM719_02700 [Thermomonas sp.]
MLAVALLSACGGQREPFARMSGLMVDEALGEVSGMAASRRFADVLWVENDSGNTPMLYAVSPRGALLASDRVEGVVNTDWEDLAAFELDGHRYILVADTGDNGGLRRTLQLHVVEEPASLGDTTLRPAWSVSFRWPDGPRDCEAAFVDAAAGKVLLISKKRHPPELFEVPLRPAAGATVVARRIGALAGVPQADAQSLEDRPRAARLVGQVTAADLSPDGRTLAVLTYQDVLFYPRRQGESWAQAVARRPTIKALPTLLPQAEALAWSANGAVLYATGEFRPAPIFYLDPAGE